MKKGNKELMNCEEFKSLLNELVELYGTGNWADIARNLSSIHNYNVDNIQVAQIWRLINPKRDKFNLTIQQNLDFYKQWIVYSGNVYQIKEYLYEKYKLRVTTGDIIDKFTRIINQQISKILKDLSKTDQFYSKYEEMIKNFRFGPFRLIINIGLDKDTQDEVYNRLRTSGQYLAQLCEFLQLNSYNSSQYKQLLQQIKDNPSKFLISLEDTQFINNLIRLHKLAPSEKLAPPAAVKIRLNDKQQTDSDDSDQIHFPQFYNQIESDLTDSDADHFPQFYCKKPRKCKKKQQLRIYELYSQEEIENLKNSFTYQKLFDKDQIFYNWFNTASFNKADDLQNFTIKLNKESQQMNKKVKINKSNDKFKTIRGKIRFGKEIYVNKQTIQFKYDQDEDNEDENKILKMFCHDKQIND